VRERVLYGAGVAVFSDVGDLLCAEFSGPLTPLVVERFRGDVVRYGDKIAAGAAVLRLERAMIAISREEMLAADSLSIAGLPIAIVASPGAHEEFQAHAWEMAQLGYLRGVFSEVSAAFSWAQTKVGLARRAPQAARKSHAL